jgi:hypothetical protein
MTLTSEAGATSTSAWISSWPTLRDANHTHDGGFGALQSLEISFLMSHSRTAWFYVASRLLLALALSAAALLTHGQSSSARASSQISRLHAHLGCVTALFCVLGFMYDVSREFEWDRWVEVGLYVTTINDAVLLPLWLGRLAMELRRISGAGGGYVQHAAQSPATPGATRTADRLPAEIEVGQQAL